MVSPAFDKLRLSGENKPLVVSPAFDKLRLSGETNRSW